MRAILATGLDTLAACGDVNRNVISTANPLRSPAHAAAGALAKRIGAHLLPRTRAYREIFLGEQSAAAGADDEPLYGRTYLPRKFKIAIAVPPHNDVDVFAHDLGFVAILDGGRLLGYDVAVGGGMGMTHNAPATFPRVADVVGFCAPDDALAVAEHTVAIQRDFGDRKDRAHARFKYTIEDRGVDWFRAELARRLGKPLAPARGFRFESSGDPAAWHQGADGLWHHTVFVENGRIRDLPGSGTLSGLRAIAREHAGVFALTTNQNVIIAGVTETARAGVDAALREHGLGDRADLTGLRRNSMACVALPTCALAMAESERYLPSLLDQIDATRRCRGPRAGPDQRSHERMPQRLFAALSRRDRARRQGAWPVQPLSRRERPRRPARRPVPREYRRTGNPRDPGPAARALCRLTARGRGLRRLRRAQRNRAGDDAFEGFPAPPRRLSRGRIRYTPPPHAAPAASRMQS